MKKCDVVKQILGERLFALPLNADGQAYAPTNIALCKYWGKRDQELNLPVTSSLSISLGDKGAEVKIKSHLAPQDAIYLNGKAIAPDSAFSLRLVKFLDLFRDGATYFLIDIFSTVPIAAGLASSACGFASIVLALNQLYGWNLSEKELSILARLGSGSAARSIYQGFVEWHSGAESDGMDSFAEPLKAVWPELCIGLVVLSEKEKAISSRVAMQRTVETSPFYTAWPNKVFVDLNTIKVAIEAHDIERLGAASESNATAMHATMLSAWPPICYFLPETIEAMQKVWSLREAGLSVYFTQDAGPNLKLLFLESDLEAIVSAFSDLQVIQPFKSTAKE